MEPKISISEKRRIVFYILKCCYRLPSTYGISYERNNDSAEIQQNMALITVLSILSFNGSNVGTIQLLVGTVGTKESKLDVFDIRTNYSQNIKNVRKIHFLGFSIQQLWGKSLEISRSISIGPLFSRLNGCLSLGAALLLHFGLNFFFSSRYLSF